MFSTVTDRLRGSMPITTRSAAAFIRVLRCSILNLVVEPGGHRYFEPSKCLLTLSPPLRRPGQRRPEESHTTSVGSRCESDNPGA
jgi:hypothetical protein